MNINKIDSLDFDTLYRILNSTKISDTQKTQFVLHHRIEIKKIMTSALDEKDFKLLMQNRTLQKFRPLKNSYTKWGDKIILAKTLNIKPSEVNSYIQNIVEQLEDISHLNFLPEKTFEAIKTYIYRHGTKDELITFFNAELIRTRDVLKCLYNNLEYHSCGVADYFIRPIHRMDNKTLIKIFNVISNNLQQAQKNGEIKEQQGVQTAK